MAYLLSSHTPSDKIPDTYIQPPERRGGPAKKTEVPIIDLSDEKNSISHIMDASKNIGCFQVINHGVPVELMEKTLEVVEELFKLPPDEKAKINKADDINKVCKMYTSTLNYSKEDTHSWRDVLKLNCGSLDTNLQFWPQNPGNFKDIISEYVNLVKELGSRILDYLAHGLGLEPEYFGSNFSKITALVANHYPSCPDPSLTLGISKHTDPTLINIIQSGRVPGLQVFKNGQWFSIDTPPNAFVVFMGNQIEVISNGMLKAVEHRVVNSTEARTSIVFNVTPSDDCVVGPAKALVEAQEKPIYKTFRYKEFFESFSGPKPEGHDYEDVIQALKINV
ncbi:hypothetical protein RND81_07G015200 [Saponaria officinalis]|uniref:Fe2OG dioxygenase domain-containing protein n=1 Tax=Saponaria officinalis TaxID=3572 RepID=A0AAW1JJW5_SAPOF